VLGKLFTQDVYAAVSDEMAEQAADLLAAFIHRKTPAGWCVKTIRASKGYSIMETTSEAVALTRPVAAFVQVAEADGNRTRQRRCASLTGFEDRGGHQAPGRLRS
jgi:hypothetical protein